MADKFLRDHKEGETVEGCFFLKGKRTRTAKNGKDYLDLVFEDKSGELGGKAWDDVPRLQKEVQEGRVVHLKAQVEIYNEKRQLRILALRAAFPDEADLSSLQPGADEAPEVMWGKVERIVAGEVKNPSFLTLFRKSAELYKARILQAAGAKKVHHSYAGGWLEHTLGVMETVLSFPSRYGLDRELLVMGAFLHDLGKLEEMGGETGREETEVWFLLCHTLFGLRMVQDLIAQIPDFGKKKETALLHLISSHHGTHEFGAPQLPLTKEALALHLADYLDSQVKIFDDIKQKGEGGISSEYDGRIGRRIYLGNGE